MTEPSALKTAEIPLPFTPPSLKALIDMSFTVLTELLGIYGLREDEDEAEHDYKITVNRESPVLSLDINAEASIRGILIGHRGANVLAMERILISALYRRFGLKKSQRFDRAVQLSVNGTRPPTRREDGEPPVITIIAPPGVEVRTLNPDGTSR
jgi:hypothetical protein